jgi:hypothetical protein
MACFSVTNNAHHLGGAQAKESAASWPDWLHLDWIERLCFETKNGLTGIVVCGWTF